MTPLISIIVPTYNRSYIWEYKKGESNSLVANILNQDYPNFELIIVNDGSTDNTAMVLKELASNDSRIKVINKQNAGASVARNAGIKQAKGKYAFFVDDDDNIPLDYLSSFMQDKYDGIDLIIDSYSSQIGDAPAKAIDFPEKLLQSKKEILEFVFGEMQERAYCFFPWGKRYSLSILKKQAIRFNPAISLGEDRPFVLDYIAVATNCRFINKRKYIVKSEGHATYRMSKGLKPVDNLWNNFKHGYVYLKDYEKRHALATIGAYADDYIASKSIEYILFRVASGYYKEQSAQVKQAFDELRQMGIKSANIRDKKIRVLFKILMMGGILPTVMVIKSHLLLSDMMRKVTHE